MQDTLKNDHDFTYGVALFLAENLHVSIQMSTKKFLGSSLKLIFLFLLLAGSHILIWQFAAQPIATLLAPKFVSLTVQEEEAFRVELATHRAQQEAERTEACEGQYPNRTDFVDKFGFERCMNYRFGYSWREHPKETHERVVIDPMVGKIRGTFLPISFGIIYAIIGMLSMKVLWEWVRVAVWPILRTRFSGMKERIADESILRTNKRLSAAVKQLDDLENLHERGMITDEVFHERKEEIKGALAKLNNEQK